MPARTYRISIWEPCLADQSNSYSALPILAPEVGTNSACFKTLA